MPLVEFDKYIELVSEAFFLKQLLIHLPADFPSLRELLIQNAKLLRLIDKRPHVDPFHVLGGGSLKKVNKARGKHDALCGRQARLLKSLLVKSFQKWLRVQWEKDGKTYTKKAFQAWKTQFDQGLADRVAKMKKLASDQVKTALPAKN